MIRNLLFLGLLSLNTSLAMAQFTYPKPHKDATVDDYFGQRVEDPYRWMEDDRSEATAQWVKEENEVTESYLSKIPFRAQLLQRLKQVSGYDKEYAPFHKFGRYYFYKSEALANQAVLYVVDKLGDKPRVFLDPNKLSEDGTVALKALSFSNDGKYLAYAISRSGSDWQEFYVMDVATGKLLPDHVEWAKFSGASWYKDGFYYSAYDAPQKGHEFSNVNEVHKIYYHKIGTPQSEDVLFYQNPAFPKRFYSVWVNKEETMMFLHESGDSNGNTLFVRDLRTADSQFIQMTSDKESFYSTVDIQGDSIILYTNAGAPNGRLMWTSIKTPGFKDWKEFVPEQPHVLTGMDLCADKLILTYKKDACDHSYLYTKQGKLLHEIALPGLGEAVFSCSKETDDCYYSFSSFTSPGTIYSYNIKEDKSTVYAEPKLSFSTKNLVSEQVFFTSKDGTRVPMFLLYKKGLKRNGKNPVYMYGYGGFNIGMGPYFSSTRMPFIENGGVYVQVCLRGGNEYGEAWHQAGTKMHKQNVFDDFISAAEYLIKEKYTSSEHLAIVGGSNGGLLVGACMTQRPELFKVAIPEVGVMDMLRYHKFTIGWNWASDYGTSEDSPEMFRYLLGYSPLHNLRPGTHYPATLVTTADHDDRVVPAHSFKFAARLQECQAGSLPTLIRIDTKAGHGGGKPLSKVLEEQADIYGFIMYNLGMKPKF